MMTKRNDAKNTLLCKIFWAIGLAGLPLGHYCLFARVEPFYSSIYTFLWCPLIFAVDFAVYKLRGHSLLHDRPREFWLLALWSTPAWLVYEAVNFRLGNWYYVQLPIHPDAWPIFLLPAFATVLPGVFEIMELIVGVAERLTNGRGIRGPAFRVTWRQTWLQMVIGAAMLVLTLAWPETFFCMAWGFAFFLLDPICYLKKGRSLLGQLATGDNTRFVALLLSGFISGGLWEGWNICARSKWIYSVPFFDELKLFEMPLLGFLGFPPFVLECYATINFLSLFRGGRNWELPPEENARLAGMKKKTSQWAWLAAAVLSLLTFLGIFTWSVSSYSVPLDHAFRGDLGSEGAAFLRRENAAYSHQFLDKFGDVGAPDVSAPDEIDPALFARMRAIAVMAELKGMGTRHALRLDRAGIRTPSDLAQMSPERLRDLLFPDPSPLFYPSVAQAKVWIRAARKQTERSVGF